VFEVQGPKSTFIALRRFLEGLSQQHVADLFWSINFRICDVIVNMIVTADTPQYSQVPITRGYTSVTSQ
jgi:hypothetical protein